VSLLLASPRVAHVAALSRRPVSRLDFDANNNNPDGDIGGGGGGGVSGVGVGVVVDGVGSGGIVDRRFSWHRCDLTDEATIKAAATTTQTAFANAATAAANDDGGSGVGGDGYIINTADLVIVATGTLEPQDTDTDADTVDDNRNAARAGGGVVTMRAEKSWAELSAASMHRAFAVNTVGPALVAKYFLPILTHDR
jgi:hypothetical protein